jgi:hypothetical protein
MAIHCSGGPYGGGAGGQVTYFSFTTNASAECVLLDMTTSIPGESIEAVLFTGCSSGNPTGGSAIQSVCMDEGTGIWATNLWSGNLLPNTTYYLRVRTESGFNGSIRICGKYDTPSNNLCSGAIPIDQNASAQNNACNAGSTEVTPSSLCAGSLENTAWYSYTVQATGISSIVINNIRCVNANFAGNNDYGFQIGFFTGSCGSLTSIGCNAQTGVYGGTVTAATASLPAGTVVYVAIDGFSGSNCTYNMGAINAIPLPVKLKYFTVWKTTQSNLVRWVTLSETSNDHFEIERSSNGRQFEVIGSVPGNSNTIWEQEYSFIDVAPLLTSYYRLKQVDLDGRFTYSKVVMVTREELPGLDVRFANPATDHFRVSIESPRAERMHLRIIDAAGRERVSKIFSSASGLTTHSYDLSSLSPGNYYLVFIQEDGTRKTYPFVKQ